MDLGQGRERAQGLQSWVGDHKTGMAVIIWVAEDMTGPDLMETNGQTSTPMFHYTKDVPF